MSILKAILKLLRVDYPTSLLTNNHLTPLVPHTKMPQIRQPVGYNYNLNNIFPKYQRQSAQAMMMIGFSKLSQKPPSERNIKNKYLKTEL